jgi:hypothetical protein
LINWATWLAFLTEALLMLSLVDNRWSWTREHPLEVAIVLVTPPFLPASLQAARAFGSCDSSRCSGPAFSPGG